MTTGTGNFQYRFRFASVDQSNIQRGTAMRMSSVNVVVVAGLFAGGALLSAQGRGHGPSGGFVPKAVRAGGAGPTVTGGGSAGGKVTTTTGKPGGGNAGNAGGGNAGNPGGGNAGNPGGG